MYPVDLGYDCLFHCICLQARLEIHLINAEPNLRCGIHEDDDADGERCATGDFFLNNMETGSIWSPSCLHSDLLDWFIYLFIWRYGMSISFLRQVDSM